MVFLKKIILAMAVLCGAIAEGAYAAQTTVCETGGIMDRSRFFKFGAQDGTSIYRTIIDESQGALIREILFTAPSQDDSKEFCDGLAARRGNRSIMSNLYQESEGRINIFGLNLEQLKRKRMFRPVFAGSCLGMFNLEVLADMIKLDEGQRAFINFRYSEAKNRRVSVGLDEAWDEDWHDDSNKSYDLYHGIFSLTNMGAGTTGARKYKAKSVALSECYCCSTEGCNKILENTYSVYPPFGWLLHKQYGPTSGDRSGCICRSVPGNYVVCDLLSGIAYSFPPSIEWPL